MFPLDVPGAGHLKFLSVTISGYSAACTVSTEGNGRDILFSSNGTNVGSQAFQQTVINTFQFPGPGSYILGVSTIFVLLP